VLVESGEGSGDGVGAAQSYVHLMVGRLASRAVLRGGSGYVPFRSVIFLGVHLDDDRLGVPLEFRREVSGCWVGLAVGISDYLREEFVRGESGSLLDMLVCVKTWGYLLDELRG
jgi:hypothetical protein